MANFSLGKSRLGKTSLGRNIAWAKPCLGETLLGQNLAWAKPRLGETLLGQNLFTIEARSSVQILIISSGSAVGERNPKLSLR